MARGYAVKTGTAATAKALVNIITGAANVVIVEWHSSFDGVTARALT